MQNSVKIQRMSEVIGAYCRRDLLDYYSSITKHGCVTIVVLLVKFTSQIITTRFFASRTTEKMSPTKKTHGKGTTISFLSKFIHPSQLIRNKYLNPSSGQSLEGCITVRQEVKQINRKDQLAIIIHHDNFKEADGETLQELYAVKKHFTIQAEGDPDFFFDVPVVVDAQKQPQEQLLPAAVDDDLMGENHGGQQDLTITLTGILDIDDNKEPVPEDILAPFPLYSLRFGVIMGFAIGNPTI